MNRFLLIHGTLQERMKESDGVGRPSSLTVMKFVLPETYIITGFKSF